MASNYVIINLVDQFSKVNFGIWHAAIATAPYLKDQFGIQTLLVAPRTRESFDTKRFPSVKFISIEDTSLSGADIFLTQWDPATTIVATHGAWQFPTRWGSAARKLGFQWIYTPHGMLEPWSMKQKWLKKALYFHLVEKPLASRASSIRAVGSPERDNLLHYFKNVTLVPNGVYETDFEALDRPESPITFLYLARLHYKKGVMPLVEGWKSSLLSQRQDYQLLIAGTDDGEKEKLESFLEAHPGSNIRFLGPQFEESKRKLLQLSHYYILPSQSEGFPTSVLEAMAAGLVPVITQGCNFPEAITSNLAIETSISKEDICDTLNEILQITENERMKKASLCQQYVKENYSWSGIAGKQCALFTQ